MSYKVIVSTKLIWKILQPWADISEEEHEFWEIMKEDALQGKITETGLNVISDRLNKLEDNKENISEIISEIKNIFDVYPISYDLLINASPLECLGLEYSLEIACAIESNTTIIITPDYDNITYYNLEFLSTNNFLEHNIKLCPVSRFLEFIKLELSILSQDNHVENSSSRQELELINDDEENDTNFINMGNLGSNSWTLLPKSLYLSSMRRPPTTGDEMEEVFLKLRNERGIEISSDATCAFRKIKISQSWLTFYAVTWVLSKSEPKQWILLLIYKAISCGQSPQKIKVQISDQTNLLSECRLNSDEGQFHFAQVVATLTEKFMIDIYSEEEKTTFLFEFSP